METRIKCKAVVQSQPVKGKYIKLTLSAANVTNMTLYRHFFLPISLLDNNAGQEQWK